MKQNEAEYNTQVARRQRIQLARRARTNGSNSPEASGTALPSFFAFLNGVLDFRGPEIHPPSPQEPIPG